jgi:hypothetical protein
MNSVGRPVTVSYQVSALWSVLVQAGFLPGFFFHSLPAEFPSRKIDNSFSENLARSFRLYASATL